MLLSVQVQPRASRDQVVGAHGERLKVCVTAPPADGRANAQLIKLLAREFAVPKSRISLLSGAGSRLKQLAIRSPGTLPPWLEG